MDGRRREAGDGVRGATPRRWAVRALQLVATVLVTLFIVDRVGLTLDDLRGVELARWTPRWGVFALSCLALLGGYVMSALLWGRMVRELGGPRLPPGTSIRTFMIANLGRYLPGKVWQIAGLAVLAREKGVQARTAAAAAVVGQAFAVVAAGLLGVGALLGGGPRLREIGLWVLAGALLLGVAACIPRVVERLFALWFRVSRTEPPGTLEPGPGFVLRWTGLYLANWAVYAASFWVLVRSLELPGTLLQTAPAFAAAYVLGYVALFAPAGIGIREGFLTAFLGPVMGVGTAGTLSLVARLWTTGVEVVPAAALWIRHLGLRGGPSGEPDGAGGEVGRREGEPGGRGAP